MKYCAVEIIIIIIIIIIITTTIIIIINADLFPAHLFIYSVILYLFPFTWSF